MADSFFLMAKIIYKGTRCPKNVEPHFSGELKNRIKKRL